MPGQLNKSDDFKLLVAKGEISKVSHFYMFAKSPALTADTETDLNYLSAVTPFPAYAGESLEIVSDDVADIGMTIRIWALGPDCTWLDPFDVTLNGTTPVPLPGSLSRVNRVYNAGLTPFAGDLSVQQAGAGTVFGIALAENQQMNQGNYTIQSGVVFYFGTVIGTLVRSSPVEAIGELKLYSKIASGSAWRMVFSFGMQGAGDSIAEFQNHYPDVNTGPVDFKYTATSDTTGTIVSVYTNGRIADE